VIAISLQSLLDEIKLCSGMSDYSMSQNSSFDKDGRSNLTGISEISLSKLQAT